MLIKPPIHILLGLVITASLGACAYPDDDHHHGEHHAGQSAHMGGPGSSGASSAQGGMMGGGMTGSQAGCGMAGSGSMGNQAGCAMMGDSKAGAGGMQHMDKDAMCAMYRSMQNAPTEQDRQAMMERNMQGMSPEMRQRHIEMMRQQCQ